MKYEVITYDVWGNTREGFEVNQAFTTGRTITLPENASDYLINRRLGVRGVKWDGEPEYSLYGELKRNGMPALELRAVRD
jgi:hypothetical protein